MPLKKTAQQPTNEFLLNDEIYRMIFETANEGIVLADNQGIILLANTKFAKLVGYRKNEIIGKNLDFFVFKDELTSYYKRIELQNNGVKGHYERRLVSKNNDIVWVSISTAPFQNPQNSFIGFLAMYMEITEKKTIENALIKSENRFCLIAKNSTDAISCFSIEGIISYISPACVKQFGYKVAEVLGRHIFQFIHPDDIEKVLNCSNKTLPYADLTAIVLRIRHKDGFYIWCESNGRAVLDKTTGEIKEFQFASRDITLRIKSEEELKESRANLFALFESTNDCIWSVDPINFGIVEYNSALYYGIRKCLGIDIKCNMTPSEFFPTEKATEWQNLYKTALLKKKINVEYYFEEIDATFELSLNAITKDEEIIGISAFARNITKRKQEEAELKAYKCHLEELVKRRTIMLEEVNHKLVIELARQKESEEKIMELLEKEKELNELKSHFISVASHEFRTPLTVVLSSTELLERYGNDWSSEKLNKQIKKIKKTTLHLNDIVSDILTISRTENGNITFSPQNINIKKLCIGILEDINHILTVKHTLTFEFKASRQIYFLDGKLIQYLLSNLLSNAVKYSPDGGNVILHVKPENNNLVFKISDEGIGIPEKDQIYLFDPFHRGSNIGEIQGTGLGMSIIKRSIELHSGKLFCDSSEGKGTSFTVFIPINK